MVVDLPAPLGPRNPVTRPAAAVKVTSWTAVNPPYVTVRCSTSIMGSTLRVPRGTHIGDGTAQRPERDPETALGVDPESAD